MRTMCKAGTYYVTDPEDDRTDAEKALNAKVLNIEREYIEEHLAQCRAFAVEWSTKAHPPSMAAITRQLTRIEINIRERWCKRYRTNENSTFTRCIRDTIPTADNLWSADLSREMGEKEQPKGKGKEGKTVAKLQADIARLQRGTKTPNVKQDRGNKKGDGQKKGQGKGSIVNGRKVTVKGKMVKTAQSRGNVTYCQYFNKDTGTCNKGADCKHAHKCWVMTSGTRVCEENHSAKDHPGATVSA